MLKIENDSITLSNMQLELLRKPRSRLTVVLYAGTDALLTAKRNYILVSEPFDDEDKLHFIGEEIAKLIMEKYPEEFPDG